AAALGDEDRRAEEEEGAVLARLPLETNQLPALPDEGVVDLRRALGRGKLGRHLYPVLGQGQADPQRAPRRSQRMKLDHARPSSSRSQRRSSAKLGRSK